MANEQVNQTVDPREGEQVEGANEAANESDKSQASHWTAGKEGIRSENDIIQEAVAEPTGADNAHEQMRHIARAC